MFESIVLLWIAVQLQAPLWVYVIVMLMLVISTLSFVLETIKKVQERRIKRASEKLGITEEKYEELKQWLKEQEGKEE